jgi:hypothetical protein
MHSDEKVDGIALLGSISRSNLVGYPMHVQFYLGDTKRYATLSSNSEWLGSAIGG